MSMKSLSIVAAAALALCAGAAQAATTNGFANGGFETPGVLTPALGWGQADGGYTLSSDAYMGSNAMLLTVNSTPTAGGVPSQGFQNSVENGGMPPLMAGDMPVFSFWAKGETIFTGNAQYFLQYLTAGGDILFNTNSVQFQGQINSNSWTQIVVNNLPAVPVGATAALVRFVSAAGPTIPSEDKGVLANRILVDDVYLSVTAIPEPSTYALMLAGLAGVGFLARRRRSV